MKDPEIGDHLTNFIALKRYTHAVSRLDKYRLSERDKPYKNAIELYGDYMKDLKQTRLYSIPKDLRTEIIERSLAGVMKTLQDSSGCKNEAEMLSKSKAEQTEIAQKQFHAACTSLHKLGYPTEFPFDYMFISLGLGHRYPILTQTLRSIQNYLEAKHAETAQPGEEMPKYTSFDLYGFTVSPTGGVDAIIGRFEKDMQDINTLDELASRINPLPIYKNNAWEEMTATSGLAQIFRGLMDFINQHGSYTIEQRTGLSLKMDFKKVMKTSFFQNKKEIPPPYYTVKVNYQKLIENEEKRSGGERKQLTYRFDRAGHERVYIQRGPLPLALDIKQTLEKRGYRIYSHTLPTPEDQQRLQKRFVRSKDPREWVAIRHVWIDPTVVGDETLPYVPAHRMVGT